jgi:hypothetical protein
MEMNNQIYAPVNLPTVKKKLLGTQFVRSLFSPTD